MAFHNHYRPKRLSDVFGQEHVTRVLKNAASTGRLAEYQALLFIGTRGSGKTTTARILAHLVNCLNPKDNEPCLECDNCKMVSRSLEHGGDIVEMDAASRGGIDDIIRVIEACHYNPMGKLKKKVFIIDEAHQLSSAAKDAVLKTLEEPPAHVMFILATTEAHKIPPTIKSRCIPFQFKDGDVTSISSYLASVLDRYGVDYEKPALERVASLAAGSYREALGLVEKLVDVSESVNSAAVDEVLCLPGPELVRGAVKAVMAGDQARCISIINEVASQGKDVRLFLREVVTAILKGAVMMAERGITKSPEGLGISDILDLSEYIFTKASTYSSEMSGMVPGLVLAGAAGQAQERRH